jgi:hypothetical protein
MRKNNTEHVVPYSMLQKHRTCCSIFHATKAQNMFFSLEEHRFMNRFDARKQRASGIVPSGDSTKTLKDDDTTWP